MKIKGHFNPQGLVVGIALLGSFIAGAELNDSRHEVRIIRNPDGSININPDGSINTEIHLKSTPYDRAVKMPLHYLKNELRNE